MCDGESKTSHDVENVHCKHLQKETTWSAEASQELLRLRFRQLRDLFDNAQTVAEVHEAWSVVASTLSSKSDYGLQVDAVKCSDQLTKLRQQWQESSTNQLHVMMAECFSKNVVELQQHQSFEQPLPARNHFNKAMEEIMLHEVEAKTGKRSKKTVVEEVSVVPPPDPVSFGSIETFSSPELTLASPEPASSTAAVSLDKDRLLPGLDPIAMPSQPVPHETLLPVVSVEEEEEEFHRHGEIMRALEKRSQQLERLV